MKKILYILPLALAALVSCQKEESFTGESDAVTINATIGEGIPLGRANTTDDVATSWKNSDQIAVNNEGDSYVTYTYSGTSWAAAPGDFLKWSAETMIFNGYHPVTQGTSLTNFTLPIDQSDLAKISAADYMIVENASKTKPESGYAVDLNFTRKNARVIIKIAKFNNEFVGTPIIKNLTITSAHSNYTSGATQGASTTITPYKVLDEDTYIALVIPYNSTTNVDFINLEVTDDIDTQSLKFSEIPATEPGKSYTYNLTVGKNKIEINTVTVAEWSGTVILPDGEAINKCDDWDGTYATELTTGAGTKDDPYLIETAEQLALLSTSIYNQEGSATNYSKCCFKLTTDIDLKYKNWIPIGSGLSEGKVPWQKTFYGSFDGDGHIISGLKVTAVTTDEEKIAYIGLFGRIAPYYEDQTIPSVQNLIVRDAKIYAGSTVEGDDNVYQGAGILAGDLSLFNFADDVKQTVKIKNCRVSGTIHQVDGTTTKYVGGLLGFIQGGEVTACNANVTIDTQNGCVGGLLGYAFGTTVKNSHCKGSIKGGWSIGGFVGGAEKSTTGNMTITDCTTSVEVTASNWNVGGFIGYFNAEIVNCSASGNVISTVNWKNHLYKTGGFVGTNAGLIDKCTYSGALTYADTAEDAWKYYGGFTGNHKGGTTQDCRFDGRKNPSLDKSGLSSKNENIEIGSNDISNTLE